MGDAVSLELKNASWVAFDKDGNTSRMPRHDGYSAGALASGYNNAHEAPWRQGSTIDASHSGAV